MVRIASIIEYRMIVVHRYGDREKQIDKKKKGLCICVCARIAKRWQAMKCLERVA